MVVMSTLQTTEQPIASPSRRAGFVAGALGGLLMTLVLVALRFSLNAQIITEIMADWFTRLLPSSVFDFFIEQMGFNAKRMLFVLIFLGQISVGGLIGMAYVRYEAEAGYADGLVSRAAVLTGIIFAALVFIVTPVLGAGVLGNALPDGAVAYSGGLLFAVAAFSLTLTKIAAGLVISSPSGSFVQNGPSGVSAGMVNCVIRASGNCVPTSSTGVCWPAAIPNG